MVSYASHSRDTSGGYTGRCRGPWARRRGGGKGEEEPLLPFPVEGDSTTETESVQASAGRVKGEVRDRPSHFRLCHLSVTHWGDAVEGILEEPDFDIRLFCEMKLDRVQ